MYNLLFSPNLLQLQTAGLRYVQGRSGTVVKDRGTAASPLLHNRFQ